MLAGRDAEEDDDPSKRVFDKEKDMAIGGRISNSQRREMLNKAAGFGGGFEKVELLIAPSFPVTLQGGFPRTTAAARLE